MCSAFKRVQVFYSIIEMNFKRMGTIASKIKFIGYLLIERLVERLIELQ